MHPTPVCFRRARRSLPAAPALVPGRHVAVDRGVWATFQLADLEILIDGRPELASVVVTGVMVPVSSLTGRARLVGLAFPSAWYELVSVGTFTKGLGFQDLWSNLLVLAAFLPASESRRS